MKVKSIQTTTPLRSDTVTLWLEVETPEGKTVTIEQEFTKEEWEQISKGRAYWKR